MLKDSFIDLTLCVRVINNGLYFIFLFSFSFLFFIFFYFLLLLLLELGFRVISKSHISHMSYDVVTITVTQSYITKECRRF